jgi:hypothetical protein
MPDTVITPEPVADAKPAPGNTEETPSDETLFDDSFQDHFIIDIGDKKAEAKTKPKTEEVDEEKVGKPVEKEDKPKDEKAAKEGEEDELGTGVVKHLRDTIKRMEKKIKALETGEAKKPKADEPPPLSDDELLSIYKEHQDDPEVALKIFRYMRDQGAKTAIEAQRAIAKNDEKAKQADAFFGSIFETYHDDEFADKLNDDFPLDDWQLQGHPHAKRFQTAMAMAGSFPKMLDERVKAAVEKYKANSLKSETKRTETIQNRQPATSAKGPVAVLTDRGAQVAKELGLSPSARKIYQGFLANRGE